MSAAFRAWGLCSPWKPPSCSEVLTVSVSRTARFSEVTRMTSHIPGRWRDSSICICFHRQLPGRVAPTKPSTNEEGMSVKALGMLQQGRLLAHLEGRKLLSISKMLPKPETQKIVCKTLGICLQACRYPGLTLQMLIQCISRQGL